MAIRDYILSGVGGQKFIFSELSVNSPTLTITKAVAVISRNFTSNGTILALLQTSPYFANLYEVSSVRKNGVVNVVPTSSLFYVENSDITKAVSVRTLTGASMYPYFKTDGYVVGFPYAGYNRVYSPTGSLSADDASTRKRVIYTASAVTDGSTPTFHDVRVFYADYTILHRIEFRYPSDNAIDTEGYILSDSALDVDYIQSVFDSLETDVLVNSVEVIGNYYMSATYVANEPLFDSLTLEVYKGPQSPNGAGGYQGESGGGGGYGIGLPDSATTDFPTGQYPSLGASGTFTRYVISPQELKVFGEWLWTEDVGLNIAKAFISLIYSDPAQSIISLQAYPFQLTGNSVLQGVSSYQSNFHWGRFDGGITANVLDSEFALIQWGTVEIEAPYFGNFLDYAPYTKADLYLPWGVGFVPLDWGEIYKEGSGKITVETLIDFGKGSCVHNVMGKDNYIIGTYTGQCSRQVPLFSDDFASKVAGVVSTGISIATAGAAYGAAVAAGKEAGMNAMIKASHIGSWEQNRDARGRFTSGKHFNQTLSAGTIGLAGDVAEQRAKADHLKKNPPKINVDSRATAPIGVSRNGSFTDGSTGYMYNAPYLIVTRPRQSLAGSNDVNGSTAYGSHYGYPCNMWLRLGDLSGYTEINDIHLTGIPALHNELVELDGILKDGVIF